MKCYIVRSKTLAEWTSENPFLSRGQLGIESDTGKQKIGVGSRWSQTPYIGVNGINESVNAGDSTLVFSNGILVQTIPNNP